MLETQETKNTIIFTDLDGTLLDHKTYSFDEANEMLNFIKNNSIDLIIVTSKTKPEVIQLQKKLNIKAPFVVENGAGIFIPHDDSYKQIDLGFTYDQTLLAFNKYSQDFSMTGFHQMSVEEIAEHTGLTFTDATMAKQRTYSEPFIFEEEQNLEKLKNLANNDGFDIVKGGRFYHLITKGQDKANAVKYLIKYYNEKFNTHFHSIALGDSFNDLTMLDCVDIPILVKQYDDTYIDYSNHKLIKAPFSGPKGWNKSLKGIFNA